MLIQVYIYCLDNDDLFYDENLFDKIYEIAEETDYDIVGFNMQKNIVQN